MNIELNSESSFQYFNIIPPGDVEALFVGSRSGNKFAGILPTSGDYTVRLYLMGNAADTGQTATHKLKISIVGKNGEASPPAAFEKKLSLLGITFVVRSVTDEDGKNRVIVIPNGLKRANATVEAEIDGNIVGAEVGDLNVDSAPEIYVYTRSTDEAQRGTLHAWSSNRNLSLSPIYIPSPSEDAKNFEGYHGKDEFAVVESTLVRRFPISDISEPKTRQLQYKLHAGEATWQLKVDRVVVY